MATMAMTAWWTSTTHTPLTNKVGWADVEDDADAVDQVFFGLLEGIEIELNTAMQPT